jgi:hypothetical protein
LIPAIARLCFAAMQIGAQSLCPAALFVLVAGALIGSVFGAAFCSCLLAHCFLIQCFLIQCWRVYFG